MGKGRGRVWRAIEMHSLSPRRTPGKAPRRSTPNHHSLSSFRSVWRLPPTHSPGNLRGGGRGGVEWKARMNPVILYILFTFHFTPVARPKIAARNENASASLRDAFLACVCYSRGDMDTLEWYVTRNATIRRSLVFESKDRRKCRCLRKWRQSDIFKKSLQQFKLDIYVRCKPSFVWF